MPAFRATRVFIDGHDISQHVRSFDIHAGPNDVVSATLVLNVPTGTRFAADGSIHFGEDVAVAATRPEIRVRVGGDGVLRAAIEDGGLVGQVTRAIATARLDPQPANPGAPIGGTATQPTERDFEI